MRVCVEKGGLIALLHMENSVRRSTAADCVCHLSPTYNHAEYIESGK